MVGSALIPSMLVALSLSAAVAQAQSYPTQPVRVIVPFASGGSTDVLTRLVGDALGKRWGQQVVVDNRPGAAGNLAAEIVSKAKPDGYTLFVTAAAFAVNATLYKNLPFDPRKDFVPVAMIGATQNVLVTNLDLPAKSVAELTALAKAKPGTINYSSTGVGTSGHLTIELYKTLAKIDLAHVPYRNIGQSMSELIGGYIKLAMPTIPGALGHINAGKLRPLAVSGKARSSALPNVPTMAESGVAGYEASTWYAVLAPAGVSPEIVTKVNADIAQLLNDEAMKRELDRRGIEPIVMTQQELAQYIESEIVKWAEVVKAANIKVE
jgi:tripartite-type tricarboxylate transporter receptor subunit TctC